MQVDWRLDLISYDGVIHLNEAIKVLYMQGRQVMGSTTTRYHASS